jgi:hypothetical protein
MANNFLSGGLLGMGGMGGINAQPTSLLGEFYDPKMARNAQIKNMLLGMGVGLMSQKGLGRGAELALTMGNQAQDDYRRMAFDQYRMKTAEDQIAKADARYADETAYNRGRQRTADTQANTLFDWQMDDRQQAEDQRATAESAWDNLRNMPTTGVPVQNYGMADQLWDMGKQDEAIGMVAPDMGPSREYGLNPIIVQNQQTGEYMLLQPSKDGSPPRQVPLPEGYQYAPPTRALDTGTSYVTQPTRGVGTVGEVVPKNIREAEQEKAIGAAEGDRTVTAPGDVSAADDALALLDQIVTHPYLERGTGMSSYGNMVYGTGGYDFQNLVNQAKSGAFLTAIQQMKGLGALSNMEGQAATAAITRMDTATSKEAFLRAVADYRAIIDKARARAASRMPNAPPPPNQGNTPDPLGIRGGGG